MTQDEIIEMVKQTELKFLLNENWMMHDELEAFAKLVAAHERESWPAEMKAMENQVNILTDELGKAVKSEREACAKLCETLWDTQDNGMATEEESYGSRCAEAIRARGEQS